MTLEDIHKILKDHFKENILDLKPAAEKQTTDRFIEVIPQKIHTLLKFLQETPALYFDNILCISGVDYPDRFEVVYHFHSYQHLHSVQIRAALLDKKNPSIDSISDLWKGANWLEREIYDMFGITFNNHPDLRRILCPDDWEGHPLRKDYQHQEFYKEIKVGM